MNYKLSLLVTKSWKIYIVPHLGVISRFVGSWESIRGSSRISVDVICSTKQSKWFVSAGVRHNYINKWYYVGYDGTSRVNKPRKTDAPYLNNNYKNVIFPVGMLQLLKVIYHISMFDNVVIKIHGAHSELYLTHWGRDKMDAISQTTCSSAFSWIKMFESQLNFT